MKNVIIRQAIKEDCYEILELVKELAIYEKAGDEVSITLEEFEKLGFSETAIWKGFVAILDNKIVGISIFYDRFSTWKGRKLYLEDIVVTEKLRGNKIGKLLFEKTLNYGKENNYHGIVWQVLDWNEPAINFYKKYNARFDGEWFNVLIDY